MEQIRQAGGDKQQGRTQPPARSSDVSRVGWWFYNTLLWTIKTSSQLSSYNIFPQRPPVHGPRCTDKGVGGSATRLPAYVDPSNFPRERSKFQSTQIKVLACCVLGLAASI